MMFPVGAGINSFGTRLGHLSYSRKRPIKILENLFLTEVDSCVVKLRLVIDSVDPPRSPFMDSFIQQPGMLSATNLQLRLS